MQRPAAPPAQPQQPAAAQTSTAQALAAPVQQQQPAAPAAPAAGAAKPDPKPATEELSDEISALKATLGPLIGGMRGTQVNEPNPWGE